MTKMIEVNSNKAERKLEVAMPNILLVEDFAGLVEIAGEELVFNKCFAQLKIDFRGLIRGKMESVTDDEPTYSDEEILEADYTDWIPEARVRMSAEEKILKALGGLDPDVAAKIVAGFTG